MTQHLLIIGPPRVGKTTLARELGAKSNRLVRHSDDLIGSRAWSDASKTIAEWIGEDTPSVIEGAAVVRGLRKWLAANPEGKPAEAIYLSTSAKVAQTPKQAAMGRGVMSVWNEIASDVVARGVKVTTF